MNLVTQPDKHFLLQVTALLRDSLTFHQAAERRLERRLQFAGEPQLLQLRAAIGVAVRRIVQERTPRRAPGVEVQDEPREVRMTAEPQVQLIQLFVGPLQTVDPGESGEFGSRETVEVNGLTHAGQLGYGVYAGRVQVGPGRPEKQAQGVSSGAARLPAGAQRPSHRQTHVLLAEQPFEPIEDQDDGAAARGRTSEELVQQFAEQRPEVAFMTLRRLLQLGR